MEKVSSMSAVDGLLCWEYIWGVEGDVEKGDGFVHS